MRLYLYVSLAGAVATLTAGCVTSAPRVNSELDRRLHDTSASAVGEESGRSFAFADRLPDPPLPSGRVADEPAPLPDHPLTLEECLTIALHNHRSRLVSRHSVEMAEAQLRQALSFYFPELTLSTTYTHLGEDPKVITPEKKETLTLEGVAPVPVDVDVTLPEQASKLADQDTVATSLVLTYPLFTGGRRSAVVRQARFGVQASLEQARRTDLDIVQNVQEAFYGAQLAHELEAIIEDARLRMQVTLELTERLYQYGSGEEVDKTDYLELKIFVESLSSIRESLQTKQELAIAALTNFLGLPWESDLEIVFAPLAHRPILGERERLVGETYEFNPDWQQFRAALQAAEAQIQEARAGHFPTVGLFGRLTHIDNDYDAGYVHEDAKDTWAAGVAIEMPLFRGFRTVAQVREAKARLDLRLNQGILLREGLALQVKALLLELDGVDRRLKHAEAAAAAAQDNRELHGRAYADHLVETDELIETQLIEVLTKFLKVQSVYEHIEARIALETLVGAEVMRELGVAGEQVAETANLRSFTISSGDED